MRALKAMLRGVAIIATSAVIFFAAAPVAAFAADTPPDRTITGWMTSYGIAVDANGYVYADYGNMAIAVFAPGATGASTPVRFIGGPNTGLGVIEGLGIDSLGNLYAASDNSIRVFAPNANGNVAPLRTIEGPNTGITHSLAIAFDGADNLYITDTGLKGYLAFTAYADGNATPTHTVTAGDLLAPYGIAVLPNGQVAVVDYLKDIVLVFYAGANGYSGPNRWIQGSNTGLSGASGLVVNAAGEFIVANSYGDQILVFAPGAIGNATPVRTIGGPQSGIGNPLAVALDSAGNIYTLNLGTVPSSVTVHGSAPIITGVDPAAGASGTTVTIFGVNFTGTSTVTFDGITATGVTVHDSTWLTAVAPSHADGPVTVAVSTAGGTATAPDAFTYTAPPVIPAPSLTSVSPATGVEGDTVTLTGSGFLAGASVTFGGVAATNVTVVSSTSITADAPAHADGAVDVAVTTAGGTATLAGAFTYAAVPSVTPPGPDPVADPLVTTGADVLPGVLTAAALSLLGLVLFAGGKRRQRSDRA